MPYIAKKKVTHWVVDVPVEGKKKVKKKRARKGDPGAYAVATETKCYYLFETGDKVVKKLFRDKVASQGELAKYILAKERGEAGITDQYTKHREADVSNVAEKFLAVFRVNQGDSKYQDETERILKKAITACCPGGLLKELTAEAIEKYLTNLIKKATKTEPASPVSPNTRKKHHSALSVFTQWLFDKSYTRENIILRVPIPKGSVQEKNKFRPLKLSQLRRLFKVAQTRPLTEVLTIRRGERKGQQVADVRPEVQEALEQKGRERALIYRLAALTGLRRSEVKKLRVRYLRKPKALPHPILDLPKSVTKTKREARLWVLPRLATRLRSWARERGLGPDDLFFSRVPNQKVFHRDREAAGIPLLTDKGKATFHSLRSAGNVLLRKAKVTVPQRKLFMRHSDIRLTDSTYDDATLLDMKDIVPTLEKYRLV